MLQYTPKTRTNVRKFMLLNAAGIFDFANKTVKLRKEVARVRLLQAERKEPESAKRGSDGSGDKTAEASGSESGAGNA